MLKEGTATRSIGKWKPMSKLWNALSWPDLADDLRILWSPRVYCLMSAGRQSPLIYRVAFAGKGHLV